MGREKMMKRKLSRDSAQRKVLLNSLAKALFRYGQIQTTRAKAKELQRFAERLLSLAKKNDLSSRRRIQTHFQDRRIVSKLLNKAKEFQTKTGGYTRIINLKIRRGDGAQIVLVKWVE